MGPASQGFVSWQHMLSQDIWALLWPDVFHKAARKCAQATRGLSEGPDLLRKLMRLFRFSRGPFQSSRFGKLVADARTRLTELLEENPDLEFAQMWIPGMARDQAGLHGGALSVAEFETRDAVQKLRDRAGDFITSDILLGF